MVSGHLFNLQYNAVIKNLICGSFKYMYLMTIFSNSRDFTYYLRSVLWVYKLLFFKLEPPFLINYKLFSGNYFL